MTRMTKKDIRRTQGEFWIVWTIFIVIPASFAALILSNGTWWSSTLAVFISVMTGYSVCERWIKRRQWKADNTLVMCYCTHAEEAHGASYDMDRACYYGSNPEDRAMGYLRACLCRDYTPRFWQMSGRT